MEWRDGYRQLEQAIVDVGGFLGMGEHRFGLTFDEMQVMTNADHSEVRIYIRPGRRSSSVRNINRSSVQEKI